MTGAETDSIGSGTISSVTVGSICFAFPFPFHPGGWCIGVETEATSGVDTILGLVLRFVGVVGRGGAVIEGRNWRRSFSLPRVCRDGPAIGTVLSMRSKLDLY